MIVATFSIQDSQRLGLRPSKREWLAAELIALLVRMGWRGPRWLKREFYHLLKWKHFDGKEKQTWAAVGYLRIPRKRSNLGIDGQAKWELADPSYNVGELFTDNFHKDGPTTHPTTALGNSSFKTLHPPHRPGNNFGFELPSLRRPSNASNNSFQDNQGRFSQVNELPTHPWITVKMGLL